MGYYLGIPFSGIVFSYFVKFQIPKERVKSFDIHNEVVNWLYLQGGRNMSMVIKNNKEAINALNTLNQNADALTKSLQKVSTGMKINGAADDASGYAISERMRVQLRSLEADISNTQNATSFLKTAEGPVSSAA